MALPYVLIVIGTVATMMLALLLLLRVKSYGRPPLLALAQKWIGASTYTSSLVVAALAVVAVSCFASILENAVSPAGDAAVLRVDDTLAAQNSVPDSDDDADAAQVVESLRAYANSMNADRGTTSAQTQAPNSVPLPDVDTMIAKLVARLEKEPNDVSGWKTLGWSYLNTNRSDDAIKAYQSALKLEPGNLELQEALDQARSAQNSVPQPPSNSASPPTADQTTSTKDLSIAQRDDMIHGMVDKLAARLDASPNDENGWLRLMSSRMTLGEKDAAKTALMKALAVFADNADARGRLIVAARELGIESH